MSSGEIPICEYEDISKDMAFQKGWTERDWQELRLYAKLLEKRSEELGIEDPIKYDETTINLGSYCGRYRLTNPRRSVVVTCRHFNESEVEQIVDELVQWCARLGPNIFAQLRSYLPIDEHEYILSLSMMLRELTEQIFTSYITPLVEERTILTPSVMGTINVPLTSRYLLQGKAIIANRKVNLNFVSLPILLLIRFNYEIVSSLEQFLDKLKTWMGDDRDPEISIALEQLAKTNMNFHSNVLNQRRFTSLFDRALDINFEDSTIIDKTIQQTSSNESLKDLVYLWEVFKGSSPLLPQLNQLLLGGFTLKPMSKLFELWALKQLTSILSKLTSSPHSHKVGLMGSITFEFEVSKPKVRLFFNPRQVSSLLKFNNVRWRLRPDFIISIGDSISVPEQVLIADAKYKLRPESSDEQKMLEYLLAFGLNRDGEHLNGIFIHVGERTTDDIQISEKTRKYPDVKLTNISIRPGIESKFETEFRNIMNPIIS